jgi:dihydrofolate reductase
MRVVLIAALAQNGVIGRDGALPWHLPDDLRHFKRRTLGRPVLMGRKTWDSIGRALPGRLNLVLTRREDFVSAGAETVRDVAAALERAHRERAEELCVIGGGEVYAATLALADELVLTHVDTILEGDARFPDYDPSSWRLADEQTHPADERHAHAFRIATYTRVAAG